MTMKAWHLFFVIWLFPLGLWVVEVAFLQYLRWSNTDCIVHGGFARECYFFGSDISNFAFDVFMLSSWGAVFFTLPWLIGVGILGILIFIISKFW